MSLFSNLLYRLKRLVGLRGNRVYLAGPDVFFEDAPEHFARLQKMCAERGLVGVVPSDGGLSKGLAGTGPEIAHRIYLANIDLIRSCDAVLANLMPFRNHTEPDSGTVFEVGFGIALGKPVYGYLPGAHEHYEDKIKSYFGCQMKGDLPFCERYGFLIESFQQPLNLMLSRSTPLYQEAVYALDDLAKNLLQPA